MPVTDILLIVFLASIVTAIAGILTLMSRARRGTGL